MHPRIFAASLLGDGGLVLFLLKFATHFCCREFVSVVVEKLRGSEEKKMWSASVRCQDLNAKQPHYQRNICLTCRTTRSKEFYNITTADRHQKTGVGTYLLE